MRRVGGVSESDIVARTFKKGTDQQRQENAMVDQFRALYRRKKKGEKVRPPVTACAGMLAKRAPGMPKCAWIRGLK